jgi:hypothetical protein
MSVALEEALPVLPKGNAKKVTVYLNQDTRAHVDTLWSAILGYLRHKHVAGATLIRADAGFGSHEQFSNPASEYVTGHTGVRIEFVETPEKVDELLPTLYDMVTDGLIIVQEVTVIKSVSQDAKAPLPESKPARKIVNSSGKLVRIYLGESDKRGGEPLYQAIVNKLRMLDYSGATVYRGILGYGAKGHTHKAGPFHLSHDLPIMISVVERAEKVNDLVGLVAEMMQDGIIVTSDVELHHVEHAEQPIR